MKNCCICRSIGGALVGVGAWHAVDGEGLPAAVTFLFSSALFLNETRLLDGVRGLLLDLGSAMTPEPKLVSMTTPSFGCYRGYRLDSDGNGCGESFLHEGCESLKHPPITKIHRMGGGGGKASLIPTILQFWISRGSSSRFPPLPVVCPAGSFSQEGACLLCPEGTYQEEKGRGFCKSCPKGSSPVGASSVTQCGFF